MFVRWRYGRAAIIGFVLGPIFWMIKQSTTPSHPVDDWLVLTSFVSGSVLITVAIAALRNFLKHRLLVRDERTRVIGIPKR